MYSELKVELGHRSYPIVIGNGLLQQSILLKLIKSKRILVITNLTIPSIYCDQIKKTLDSLSVKFYHMPDGEQYKNLTEANKIFDYLLDYKFDRDCAIMALGGGVIGDVAGFVAASYQRGVDFIQLPTTLLAQVDSSVGGKVGINHHKGKNMIGAFYQPKAVIVDIATLNSLPVNQIRSGLAEIIKYSLIFDANFFVWIEDNLDRLLELDEEAISYAIEKSCNLKAQIVALDEYEQGTRALLNLGHTYGHAIEAQMGYGKWLHGEAIAAGTCMAAYLSNLMGHISTETLQRIENIYIRAGLPIAPPLSLKPEAIVNAMQMDKKVKDGKVRLVLLQELGQAYITHEYSKQDFDRVFDKYYT